ncbi:hypothetical protein J3R82DRAFT_3651 [Butyriboletus roseoflavus]|nr:hypothetical protein J3R82DRAFT_3651 [Butyriboletus roseoflavus]
MPTTTLWCSIQANMWSIPDDELAIALQTIFQVVYPDIKYHVVTNGSMFSVTIGYHIRVCRHSWLGFVWGGCWQEWSRSHGTCSGCSITIFVWNLLSLILCGTTTRTPKLFSEKEDQHSSRPKSRTPTGTQLHTRNTKTKGDYGYILSNRKHAEILITTDPPLPKSPPEAHCTLSQFGLKIPTHGLTIQSISDAILEFFTIPPSLIPLHKEILKAVSTTLDNYEVQP